MQILPALRPSVVHLSVCLQHIIRMYTWQVFQVYRINNKYNILYVSGCIPGYNGSYVRVTDARRKPVQEPPFPTSFPDSNNRPEEEFADEIMQPDKGTVQFETVKQHQS